MIAKVIRYAREQVKKGMSSSVAESTGAAMRHEGNSSCKKLIAIWSPALFGNELMDLGRVDQFKTASPSD